MSTQFANKKNNLQATPIKAMRRRPKANQDNPLYVLQRAASKSPPVQELQNLQSLANTYALQAKTNRKAADKGGLPSQLKAGIESLSGISMDEVKVHRNSSAPATVGAHAYAQGNNIHLGPGQEKHLPHEAWHVVQQRQGRVKPTMQLKTGIAINDDAGLEREADIMGARALQRQDPERAGGNLSPNLQMDIVATMQMVGGDGPYWWLEDGELDSSDEESSLVVEERDEFEEQLSSQSSEQDLNPETDLNPVEFAFEHFKSLSPGQAQEMCQAAALKIGHALEVQGHKVEYCCIYIWIKGHKEEFVNHFVVIADGNTVYDPTAHQFRGGQPMIGSFDSWRSRITKLFSGGYTLARLVRGNMAQCESIASNTQVYYWDCRGEPLRDYDEELIAKFRARVEQSGDPKSELDLPRSDSMEDMRRRIENAVPKKGKRKK